MGNLFYMFHFFIRIHIRLLNSFWAWYHVQECKHYGVHFDDENSVCFDGLHSIIIKSGAYVNIGQGFISRSDRGSGIETTMTKILVGEGATLTIGEQSGMSNTIILCKKSITIGKHVLIGGGVVINDSNHHSLDWRERGTALDKTKAISSPIVIGDYVFIGARCIIQKGVTIGEKSIIAAGSVVIYDIPPCCVAGGNPAKVIRYLEDKC